MDDFQIQAGSNEDGLNETASWLETSFSQIPQVECELGSLVAAASDWTEDEMELDDLVVAMVETGQVELSIG